MPTTSLAPTDTQVEPYFELAPISYAEYAAINDAIGDRRNPRMIYAKGKLVLMSPSRTHDWYADVLGDIFKAAATGCGISWSPSGQATYRHPDLEAGVEGDRVFYVGGSALLMSGPREIDLATQPPPELAIEVEHTHPADHALRAWGKIGVREVWRYNVRKRAITFWSLRDDATYELLQASGVFPRLLPADIHEQLRLAESLGLTSDWYAQLPAWVRDTLLPRLADPS
jgi:Uma2 family endonuclease